MRDYNQDPTWTPQDDEPREYQHVPSPDHHPGTLYDCDACMNYCYCDDDETTTSCIHCEEYPYLMELDEE